MRGMAATMMSVVTVAGIFAELLVRQGLLTADEAKGALCAMADEVRDDGNANEGKTALAAFAIAGALDGRAFSLKSLKEYP